MSISRVLANARWGLAALLIAGLAGCSGGGGGGSSSTTTPPPAAGAATPVVASKVGDIGSLGTASNAFSAVQTAGMSPVTVNSPPVIRFTVASNGTAVTNLTKGSVRFAMAQMVPAATLNTLTSTWTTPYDKNGADQWVNFKSNLAKSSSTAKNSSGQAISYYMNASCTGATNSSGTPVLSSTPCHTQDWQATTESPLGDPTTPVPATTGTTPTPAITCSTATPAATLVGSGCLVYDATNNVYVYYMVNDVKKATLPGPLGTTTTTTFWDPAAVHRVAIQMSYVDTNKKTVMVNPWYDFTTDANGNAVAANPANSHNVVDTASCNTCHSHLALHGGGRVDTHYCAMCHNAFTTDPYTGNNLDLRTMAHKIHAGRKLTDGYQVVGYQNNISDFSNVGFPQDLRNCTKCHTGDSTVAGKIDPATGGMDGTVAVVATPQGENWKSKVTKAACLTCHDDTTLNSPTHTLLSNGATGVSWYTIHNQLGISTAASDTQCQTCHAAGGTAGADVTHWVQALANRGNYKYNILSAKTTALPTTTTAGTVAVTFNIANPNSTTAPYYNPLTDLRLSSVKMALGYYNLPTTNALPEFTNYNNGGSASANVNGTSTASVALNPATPTVKTSIAEPVTCNTDNSVCSVNIVLPPNTPTQVAQGATAEVLMYGAVKETQLSVSDHATQVGTTLNGLTLAVHPETLPFAISVNGAAGGTAVPRRTILADYKCDSCHGVLDSASGSNSMSTFPVAFHSGDRGSVKACTICHDANRLSSGEVQTGAEIGVLQAGSNVSYNESFAFRRFVHGIHSAGASFRAMPYLHGNANSVTVDPNNPNVSFSGNDYSKIVGYPGALDNCTQCHLDSNDPGLANVNTRPGVATFTADQGPLGIEVNNCVLNGFDTPTAANASYGATNNNTCSTANKITNPLLFNVISPQAAACSACHDGLGASNHMVNVGGGTFGTQIGATYPGTEIGQVLSGGPQALSWDYNNGIQKSIVSSTGNPLQGTVFEACDGCHGNTSNGVNGISGLKVQDVHTGLLYQNTD